MDHSEQDKLMALEIARAVAEKGGSSYYVGGFVRDSLLGQENKDVDIEVHAITPQELKDTLDSLGPRFRKGHPHGRNKRSHPCLRA